MIYISTTHGKRSNDHIQLRGAPFFWRDGLGSLQRLEGIEFWRVGMWTIRKYGCFTLWLFNIAMENSPFIDDFPIKTSIYEGFSMAMLNNQMVSPLMPYDVLTCSKPKIDVLTILMFEVYWDSKPIDVLALLMFIYPCSFYLQRVGLLRCSDSDTLGWGFHVDPWRPGRMKLSEASKQCTTEASFSHGFVWNWAVKNQWWEEHGKPMIKQKKEYIGIMGIFVCPLFSDIFQTKQSKQVWVLIWDADPAHECYEWIWMMHSTKRTLLEFNGNIIYIYMCVCGNMANVYYARLSHHFFFTKSHCGFPTSTI